MKMKLPVIKIVASIYSHVELLKKVSVSILPIQSPTTSSFCSTLNQCLVVAACQRMCLNFALTLL